MPLTEQDKQRLNYLLAVPNRNTNFTTTPEIADTQYDKGFVVPEIDPEGGLQEYKAQNQPFYDQLANSVAKGILIAGTTFVDTFSGTAAGLIEVVAKAAEEGDTTASELLNAFINNPVSTAFNDLNEYVDQNNLVNYRTKKEMDNAWYENMVSSTGAANFWGETILKNAGFMVGAMGAGKGIANLLSRAIRLEEGRKAFKLIKDATQKIFDGVDISKKSADDLYAMLNQSPEVYKLEQAKVIADYAKQAKSIRNKTFGVQAASSTLGSLGEARLEAIGNATAFRQERERELKNQYESGALSDAEYQAKLQTLDSEVEAFQNTSFLFNTAGLTASNYIGLRNVYLKPYDYAVKNRLGEVVKITEGAEKGLYKYVNPSKYGIYGKNLSSILRESQEEQLQFAIQKGVGEYVRDKYDHTGEIGSIMNGFSKGFSEAYGSAEGWENAFAGALFGAIGLPGMGGGIYSEIKENKELISKEKEAVDNLNKFIKENGLTDKSAPLLKAVIRDFNLKRKENYAIDNDDQYTYQEIADDKFFNVANAFIEAGKFEDLIDMFKEESELSVDELKKKYSYVKDKKKPNDKTSIFEDKTDEEIKSYISQKTQSAISKLKELRDIKNNLETLYRNELITIKDKEGKDMEVMVKDYLTRHYYMSEARDRRIEKLKRDILKQIEKDGPNLPTFDGGSEIGFSEDVSENIRNTNRLLELADKKIRNKYSKSKEQKDKDAVNVSGIKTALSDAQKAIEQEDAEFSKLINILNKYNKATQKVKTVKKNQKGTKEKKEKPEFTDLTKKRFALLKDYIKLLEERRLANLSLIQLSNNSFNDLVSEIKKRESEVIEDITKQKQMSAEDKAKYDILIEQAKNAGYDTKTPIVYFKLKKFGNRLLKAIYDKNGNRIVVFADTGKPIRNVVRDKVTKEKKVSYEIDIFNQDYLIKNFGNIEFINIKEAEDLLKKQIMDSYKSALIETFNEKVGTLKTQLEIVENDLKEIKNTREEKLKKIQELKKDIISSRWDRVFTEERKEWKKTLKELEKELSILDKHINNLNNTRNELAKDINSLERFKMDINIMNDFNDINSLEDKLFQKAYDYSERALKNVEELIDNLEREKAKILAIIQDLERMLKLSDSTIKSYYSVLDATFRNEWGFIKGIEEDVNLDIFTISKNLNTNRRKLRQYAAKKGITFDEALNRFLESAKQLKLAKEDAKTLYSIENHLALNKEDLANVQKQIDEYYDILEKQYREERFYDYYNVLSKHLGELNTIYQRILVKNYSKIQIDDSQSSGLGGNGEQSNSITQGAIDMNLNSLSNVVFYGTGRHAQNTLVNGVYTDVLNKDGLPELNSNPNSIRYIKFVNGNYKLLNNPKTREQLGIRIFKVNDPNTPKEYNDLFLDMLAGNPIPEQGSFVAVIIDKKTGKPLLSTQEGTITTDSSKGNIVFQFLPNTNNLLNSEKGAKVNLQALRKFINENGYTNIVEIERDKEGKETKKYIIKKQGVPDTIFEDPDLFEQRVIEIANNIHAAFITNMDSELNKGNKVYLEIEGTNLGMPIRRKITDKDGNTKIQRSNPYEVLRVARGLKLTDKGRIEGGALKLVKNTEDEKESKLKIGTLYLNLNTGEKIPLNTEYLSNDQITTILHILKYVADNESVPLSEMYIDLPKDKYITLGGQELTKIPIFGKGNSLSVLNTLVMWGQSKKPNPKDIYVNHGYIHFGGERLPLTDVLNYKKNGNLVKFLATKKHNVNSAQLNSKSYFFEPILKDGKIQFKQHLSYEEYLLKNNHIYSTIATSNDNNYSNNLLFLSRNVIFATTNGKPIMNINTTFGEAPKPNPVVTPPPTSIPGSNTTVTKTEISLDKPFVYEEGKTYSIELVPDKGFVMKKENGKLVFVSSNISSPVTSIMEVIDVFNEYTPDENIAELKSKNYKVFEITNIVTPITPQEEEKQKENCETGVTNTTPIPEAGIVNTIDPNSIPGF